MPILTNTEYEPEDPRNSGPHFWNHRLPGWNIFILTGILLSGRRISPRLSFCRNAYCQSLLCILSDEGDMCSYSSRLCGTVLEPATRTIFFRENYPDRDSLCDNNSHTPACSDQITLSVCALLDLYHHCGNEQLSGPLPWMWQSVLSVSKRKERAEMTRRLIQPHLSSSLPVIQTLPDMSRSVSSTASTRGMVVLAVHRSGDRFLP
jgi:hypothetical protein